MFLKSLFGTILLSLSVQGAELGEYNRPLRALGMGNVYLPFVRDVDAPTVNPAALGFVSAISWEMLSAGFGVNGLDAYNNFKNASSISSTSDYNQFIGKKIWVSAFAKTSIVLPYFGISAYDQGLFSAVIRNPAYPEFDVEFLNDYGLYLSGAIPVGPLASFGMSLKRINRWGGAQTLGFGVITSGSSTAISDAFQNKGFGYGIDMAYMMKFPGPLSPSLSLMWQDVGSTAFVMTDGTAAPPRIKDNLSLGFGSTLDLPGLDLSAGLEYRHVMDTGAQFGKKLHLGAEASLPFVDVRVGMNQGYGTVGLGLDLLIVRLDIASYTVETGEYPGQSPEARIQFGLSMDLSVDADFNIHSKDGKKRKLKQRR